ncbi:unnamed protein product [Didymodactylos carnosus]|uniref:Uncharacterized protein n=1 Tax=Didymodactylos carnosus TaxID=1234261 RepID=A0A8S2UDW1_9BILA|nr:unnamed protein product [Didymodactylos carnosus]
MQDEEKIAYLLRGLKPSIQQHAIISNPKKCEDLLKHAKRVEAAAEITQPQVPVITTPTDYVEETAAALRRTTLNNHRNDYSGLNASYIKKIGISNHIHPTTTSCRTANNGQLNISGMIKLPITIDNTQVQLNTFIIEDLCTDLLLGGDFCDKYHVNINYGDKHLTIKVKRQRVSVKFHQHMNEQQVFHVKTKNDIIISLLSSKVIQVTTSSPPMSAIFISSLGVMNKQHVVAPYAILTIDHSKNTTLTLLNTTTSTQVISKGTNVGYIKYHEENRCCYVRPDPTTSMPGIVQTQVCFRHVKTVDHEDEHRISSYLDPTASPAIPVVSISKGSQGNTSYQRTSERNAR